MAVPGMTAGEQKPLVKYNAKTKTWQIDDRTFGKIKLIVDLDNAETGWMRFAEGVAPDFTMVPMADVVGGKPFPPRPDGVDANGKPLFKRGFRLTVKVPDGAVKGDAPTVREFASNALTAVRGLDKLHTAWLAERKDGQVPIVSCEDYVKTPGQFGANYEPIFTITTWVPRPADLTAGPQSTATNPVEAPEDFDVEDDDIPNF